MRRHQNTRMGLVKAMMSDEKGTEGCNVNEL